MHVHVHVHVHVLAPASDLLEWIGILEGTGTFLLHLLDLGGHPGGSGGNVIGFRVLVECVLMFQHLLTDTVRCANLLKTSFFLSPLGYSFRTCSFS